MRYSACATCEPAEMMQGLIDTGYHAVYITEHDAVWTDQELADLRGQFPALKIFPGVELSQDDWHVVVLGSNDPEYLSTRDPAWILDKARREGHLTVLAHPYRWANGDAILHAGLRPDALEFRTNNHDAPNGLKSAHTAAQLQAALVNAGDSHSIAMLNRFWIETQDDLHEADDIRPIVLAGWYKNCSIEG